MNLNISKIRGVIEKELEIEFAEKHEEEAELLEAITRRVNELLESDPGLLFSYLYRLDVLEYKVKNVMNNANDKNPSWSLANLILERQIQRLKTKKTLKQKPIDGWEW